MQTPEDKKHQQATLVEFVREVLRKVETPELKQQIDEQYDKLPGIAESMLEELAPCIRLEFHRRENGRLVAEFSLDPNDEESLKSLREILEKQ